MAAPESGNPVGMPFRSDPFFVDAAKHESRPRHDSPCARIGAITRGSRHRGRAGRDVRLERSHAARLAAKNGCPPAGARFPREPPGSIRQLDGRTAVLSQRLEHALPAQRPRTSAGEQTCRTGSCGAAGHAWRRITDTSPPVRNPHPLLLPDSVAATIIRLRHASLVPNSKPQVFR